MRVSRTHFECRANKSLCCRLSRVAQQQPVVPRRRVQRAAAAEAPEVEEDLWQYADRDQWYLAKFCAQDQPDWNPARFLRSSQLGPGIRCVQLQ
jgi:hypothetical protein